MRTTATITAITKITVTITAITKTTATTIAKTRTTATTTATNRIETKRLYSKLEKLNTKYIIITLPKNSLNLIFQAVLGFLSLKTY
jgi:hypothetical protein